MHTDNGHLVCIELNMTVQIEFAWMCHWPVAKIRIGQYQYFIMDY